jgi:hypothetical protein
MSAPPCPNHPNLCIAFSELAPCPLSWLWAAILPRGKLVLLEGDPGLGKSLLALDLCARLTTGRPGPDGAPSPGPANVLILCAEDGLEDTVLPRLGALGADLDRVFTLRPKDADAAEPLSFPAHTGLLDAALKRTQAALVVIDPITAFLGRGVSPNQDQSIRRALAPLLRLAAQHHCTILLVRHLNKILTLQALYRGAGSIGFLALCRAAWLVAPDPNDPKRRLFAQVKNNLAAPQPSLAYSVTAAAAGPLLSWLGPSDLTADQLVCRLTPPPTRDAPRARARDLLEDFLQDGPRNSDEVRAFAEEHHLAERTLWRAKKDLKIQSMRVHLDGRRLGYWLLPGQCLPESIPSSAIACDPADILGDNPNPDEDFFP